MVEIVKGNLITLAKQGKFDVIAHGCNCMNTMGAGIAVAMKNAFACDTFPLEWPIYKGNINKLGTIDAQELLETDDNDNSFILTVINCYTQYEPGVPNETYNVPFDYDAFNLCLRKINHIYKGKRIGLPWIGCGLAGANKEVVESYIRKELKDCQVTIVEL